MGRKNLKAQIAEQQFQITLSTLYKHSEYIYTFDRKNSENEINSLVKVKDSSIIWNMEKKGGKWHDTEKNLTKILCFCCVPCISCTDVMYIHNRHIFVCVYNCITKL